MTMPFGHLGAPKRPAQQALLHAGLEFIPRRDREIIWLRAEGYTIEKLAERYEMPGVDIERSLARTARTLAAWERNACRWATRYVAWEPMAQAPGATPEAGGRRGDGMVEE